MERKICLSVTGFHPEAWQPAWTSTHQNCKLSAKFLVLFVVRTILIALRDHFTVEDRASIGYLEYSAEDRRDLAQRSLKWTCPDCDYNRKDQCCNAESGDSGTLESAQLQPNLLVTGVVLLVLSLLLSYIYLK